MTQRGESVVRRKVKHRQQVRKKKNSYSKRAEVELVPSSAAAAAVVEQKTDYGSACAVPFELDLVGDGFIASLK